jgi:hypothetical protein
MYAEPQYFANVGYDRHFVVDGGSRAHPSGFPHESSDHGYDDPIRIASFEDRLPFVTVRASSTPPSGHVYDQPTLVPSPWKQNDCLYFHVSCISFMFELAVTATHKVIPLYSVPNRRGSLTGRHRSRSTMEGGIKDSFSLSSHSGRRYSDGNQICPGALRRQSVFGVR